MAEKTWWYSCEDCQHEFVLDKEKPQVFCPECDELLRYYLDCRECRGFQRVDVTIWTVMHFAGHNVVCDFCRQQSYLIRKHGPDGANMMF